MKRLFIVAMAVMMLLPGMVNAVTKGVCLSNNTLEISEDVGLCIENRTGMGEIECSNYTIVKQITCPDGCDYPRGQCVNSFMNFLVISVLVVIVLIFILSRIIYR